MPHTFLFIQAIFFLDLHQMSNKLVFSRALNILCALQIIIRYEICRRFRMITVDDLADSC